MTTYLICIVFQIFQANSFSQSRPINDLLHNIDLKQYGLEDHLLRIGSTEKGGSTISYINSVLNFGNMGQSKISRDYLQIYETQDSINPSLFMAKQDNQFSFEIYSEAGDSSDVSDFAGKVMGRLDSLFNLRGQTVYTKFSKTYQTNIREQENLALKKENKVKELQIIQKSNQTIFFSVMSVLWVILLGLTSYEYKKSRDIARMLEDKNNLITIQKEQLSEANTTKKKLLSIISHDLINPFNTVLGFTNLLNDSYDDLKPEQHKEYIKIINQAANKNFTLTKNLLDWARARHNKLAVDEKPLMARNLMDNAIAPYIAMANTKDLNIVNATTEIEFLSDESMLLTILGNIFCNAVKFTKPSGTITIENSLENRCLLFSISDEGPGFQGLAKEVLEGPETNEFISKVNENTIGLGLMLCQELIKVLKGELIIKNNELHGATVQVAIPV